MNNMRKLTDYKSEKMKDAEFVRAYEELEPEMTAIRVLIDAEEAQKESLER